MNKFIFLRNKRGQVTIFIIIAILLILAVLLLYFLGFGPEIIAPSDETNPQMFIKNCLEDKLTDTIRAVSLRGGSVNPERYFNYNDIPIGYLCYTNEYEQRCVEQIPLLRAHIQEEIENEIQEDVIVCFNSLKESYESRNYEVQLNSGRTVVEILPNRIITRLNYVLTLKKGQTDRYDSFTIPLSNNLYELIVISQDIIEEEILDGNSNVISLMFLNQGFEIEKNLRDDGTKIYIISEMDTENKFQFASRSLVIPPGY
ncbi:hypothetical protein K0A97_01460 [Patescibacteria group bacterium]|nr:hypothetical protein [Patescibacteria group bacterium]